MNLYPYQQAYLRSKANLDITNKSRQIGISSGSIAVKSIDRVLSGYDQLLVSSSQRQANKLMSYVEAYLQVMQSNMGLKLTADKSTQKTFTNRKSIYCFPSKPETVRGFPGDVRIDEFALHREDKKMFEALLPSISSNKEYQLSIVSTPLGCNNMFYEIYSNYSNKYPDFVRTEINCYDAIKQGCKLNLDLIKRNFDAESFQQEYECKFIDETTSFFSYDLLKSCIDEYDNSNGKNCMGIDIGRTKDKTAIAVTVDSGDCFYLKRLETLSNKAFDIQKFTIKQLFQEYSIAKALQDKGAIGYQLAEELELELINYEGVFTNNSKFMNDVVTFTKKLMEQGKFKFNEDRNLINAFHKVQKKVSESNHTTYVIPRDNNGHGDEAVAVMLSLYCHKNNVEAAGNIEHENIIDYETISKKLGII